MKVNSEHTRCHNYVHTYTYIHAHTRMHVLSQDPRCYLIDPSKAMHSAYIDFPLGDGGNSIYHIILKL